MSQPAPYSYRNDEKVPAFDEAGPLLIFDGECVLCSGSVGKLLLWDKRKIFRYATAQSKLGQALLMHYKCNTENFNTVLLVSEGKAYTKSDAYIEVAHLLGGWWSLLAPARFIPQRFRNWLYDIKARNRYKWFGKTDYCALLPKDMGTKLIDR